jgi:ankyrin repeat protein
MSETNCDNALIKFVSAINADYKLYRVVDDDEVYKFESTNVKKWIQDGFDLNCKMSNKNTSTSIIVDAWSYYAIVEGMTPLDIACQAWNVNAVNLLLHAGADPTMMKDINTISRSFSLAQACLSHNFKLAKWLADNGSDVNNVNYRLGRDLTRDNYLDRRYDTPLQVACRDNNELAVDWLLNNGANVNLQNNDGLTPLEYAARKKENYNIVLKLLDKGANPNIKTDTGWYPVDAAYYNGNYEIVDLLLSRNAKSHTGFSRWISKFGSRLFNRQHAASSEETFSPIFLQHSSSSASSASPLPQINLRKNGSSPSSSSASGDSPLPQINSSKSSSTALSASSIASVRQPLPKLTLSPRVETISVPRVETSTVPLTPGGRTRRSLRKTQKRKVNTHKKKMNSRRVKSRSTKRRR